MNQVANVLVTGGAGFIGSHVAESLVARGHRVTVLDDLSGGFEANVPAGASFVPASVTDAAAVDRICAEGRFDYVFHLAAYAAEGLSHFIRRFNYTNNVLGSVNLVNASLNSGVRGIVFTSSIAVYGTAPELPMTESTPARPEDPYGIAKLAIEQDLAAAHAVFGLKFIVFRPHNVYGPRQNIGDRYRNVVGIFMSQILRGEAMTIFGDGTQTRAFSYVDDVAPLIAAAIDVPAAWNEVFNLGADRPCTLTELARMVAKVMGVAPRIVHLPARVEVAHAHSAHRKARDVFGGGARVDLEDGLARMAAWVREHGARKTRAFDAIEVRRRLPAAWLEQ